MDTQQYLKGKPFESFTGGANTVIPLSIHGTLQLHLQPQADGHQSLHSPSNSQTTPQHRQHQDTWQLWDTLPWTARLLMHMPVLRNRASVEEGQCGQLRDKGSQHGTNPWFSRAPTALQQGGCSSSAAEGIPRRLRIQHHVCLSLR